MIRVIIRQIILHIKCYLSRRHLHRDKQWREADVVDRACAARVGKCRI
jgi:hypothetical protein